jgi:HAD superfamily hydrolase (TIGR01509 family)
MPLARQVVFDLDGLIADSEPLHDRANDLYVERAGLTLDEGLRDEMMGRRVRELTDVLAAQRAQPPDPVFAAREAIFWELLEGEGVQAMPGLDKAVARLTAAALPLAVVSSGTSDYVEFVLRWLGVRGAFQVVVSGEEVRRGKPDPEGYLLAARLLRAEPADCVALEDTFHGIAAARAAGMHAVAIPNALTAGTDFSAADAVVDDLEAAAAYVLAPSSSGMTG